MKNNFSIAGFVWYLLSFFVFSVTPCLASVTGTVTDTTGKTVSGALVTFTDESNPENEYSDCTDDEGNYSISFSPTVVDEYSPAGFHLDQNYPNPFNPSTTIPFSLNETGFVNLSIFNIMGQKVRTLVDNYHSVGSHTVTWNGLDDSGKSVAAGIYIYQLKCGDTVESRKMLLIDGGSSGSFSGSNQIVTRANIMAKSVSNSAYKTFLVTITGDDIEPYEDSGVTIIDEGTYNFVVNRTKDITFVSIPVGTFQMGDEDGEWPWCMPVHTVTVSDFDMSTTEITNAQYATYLNKALASGEINEPSEGSVTGNIGEYNGQEYIDLFGLDEVWSFPENECWIRYKNNTFVVESGYEKWPVVWVTWYGAKAFALYYGFDLPREAEWEYATRGGKHYKYGTDDGTISTSKANYWNTGIKHPVDSGSYPANPFGLYDMSGNVWEWCNDCYDEYSSDSVTDPMGPQTGATCIFRGGSWINSFNDCRSARRVNYGPSSRYPYIGFRVVRRVLVG